jgi:hypothetical protein
VGIVSAQATATLCSGTSSCSIGSAVAVCPAGTRPISGGVVSSALNGTFVDVMTTSNGWAGAADNYDALSSVELTVFAYCSAGVQSVTFPDGTVRSITRSAAVARTVAEKRAARGVS